MIDQTLRLVTWSVAVNSCCDRGMVYNVSHGQQPPNSIAKRLAEMDAITTNQAMNSLDGLVDRVIENMQPTIICNENGNKAVLVSLDEFSAWQETIYLLSNPVNADRLIASIRSAEIGRVHEKSLIEE